MQQEGPPTPTPAVTISVGSTNIPSALRVVDCPELDDNAFIYFQNIQGLRENEDKLEYISHVMPKHTFKHTLKWKLIKTIISSSILPRAKSWTIMVPNINQNKGQNRSHSHTLPRI